MTTIDLKQELIRRCVKGERSAQYELYNQYSKGMYNVCVRLVGDRMMAEDILQESFVMIFKNIKSFKGDSTPGAWIKRIVVNNCISQLRKKKVEITDLDEVYHIPEISEATDHNVAYNVDEIKTAVRKLPQGYKVIFSLYAMEGYDHEEISGILGITESTSKSQYHRAKKKIRELMNK